jgi:Protein of unknown function, DUF481
VLPPSLPAQIVNVQPLIASDPGGQPKPGFAWTAEAGLDARRGNTRALSVSGNSVLQYRTGRHLFFAMVRGEYAERPGDGAYVDKDLEHIRYRIWLKGILSAETFVQHDRDSFRRLALRGIVGAGPRVHLIDVAGINVASGLAYMLELERVGSGDFPDAGEETLVSRASSYLLFTSKVHERITLGNVVYVQPRLDRLRDVRVLSEASLLFKATTHFSMKLSLASTYDSRPPLGVGPLDATVKSTLGVSF